MEQINTISQNGNLVSRPPIIVVMGHVDHGKTAILDFIRKTKIVEKEAGGITQHIGAYEIVYTPTNTDYTRTNADSTQTNAEHFPQKSASSPQESARKITFIDTPGHEAFSKMRSRGAKIADIAVLVIAADEGFKPQTKEALQAIKNEKMPYLIALNKIDKPNANPEMVKKQCALNEVYIEEWGGKTPIVLTSAKTGQGIDELLELILLIADLENFRADPLLNGSGAVVESHLDTRRGNTATLIIQNGTLKRGMFVAAGNTLASAKILEDFFGRPLESATFSSPVLITGFNLTPAVGSAFQSFNSRQEAESFLKKSAPSSNSPKIRHQEKERMSTAIEIHLILKADTAGSLEALEGETAKLENENVKIEILNGQVGEITEEDIKLASSGENAIIAGFNINLGSGAAFTAERLSVTVKTFDIIYKLIDWLKEEIENRLPPQIQEDILGKAEVLKIFKKNLPRQIIGGRVLSGKIIKAGYFRIFKKEKEQSFQASGLPIEDGKILELEQNKVKSEEVKEGNQFGAMVEVKREIQERDILEIFERKTLKKKIY